MKRYYHDFSKNWNQFTVTGWNIAEIFFFILSMKEAKKNSAIVLSCFSLNIDECWDLPEEGGFIFSIRTKDNEKKFDFISPEL